MPRFELTVIVGTAMLVAAGLILVFESPALITRLEAQASVRAGRGAVDVAATELELP